MRYSIFSSKGTHTAQKKRKSKRTAAFVLAAVLLLSITAPVLAAVMEENTPKQEVVYINLNHDGSVSDISVVNIFDLTEDGQIVDYGNYTALRNMTTSDKIQFENETVRIDTKAGELYYEGTLSRNIIPWDFSIHYYLDGKECEAQELAGQSGALEISVSIRKNPDCNSSFFENYGLQASITLDTGLCKNISAEGATTANVGKNKQLSYTILPDSEKAFSIKADVKNFEMDAISINGLPINMDVDVNDADTSKLENEVTELEDAVIELDDGAAELLDGAVELKDGSLELKDGAVELVDGVNELHEGSVELKDGAAELRSGSVELDDGVTQFDDGVAELCDGVIELLNGAEEFADGIEEAAKGALAIFKGADQLSSGAKEAKSGASELYSGLYTLSQNSTELRDGAYEVFVQLCDTAEEQLNPSLEAAGFSSVSLSPENYSSVIGEILNALSGGAYSQAEQAAKEQIRAQVEYTAMIEIESSIRSQYAEMGVEPDEETVEKIMAEQIESDEVQSQIEAAVVQQLASEKVQQQISLAVNSALGESTAYQGILTLKEYLDSFNAFYLGIVQYTKGVDSATSGAYELNTGLGDLADGAAELGDGALELYEGLQELEDGSAELLDGVLTLKDGVITLQDSVLELKDGTTKLLDGAIELEDGTLELYDGIVELKDGTAELLDGAIALYDGTVELYDGVIELKYGTFEFRDKTADLDTELKEKINEAIRDMLGGDFEVISFVSDKNTNIDSVQFVIRTEAISIDEVLEAEITEEIQLTFWQKLLRLFGLY